MVQHHRPDYEWLESMLGASRKPPASFDPAAPASGVGHVAPTVAHMADITTFVCGSNNASKRTDSMVRGPNGVQWDMGKFVVLAAPRAQAGGSIWLPGSGRGELEDFIRERPSLLQHAQCTSRSEDDLLSEWQWPI